MRSGGKNKKQNIFISARKRGFSHELVVDLLKIKGYPLPYSSSPTTVKVPYIGPNGETFYTRGVYNPCRDRELNHHQLTTLKKVLGISHD